MRNLATALLRYETIRTTVPKAKELRRVVEPIITLGKADNQRGPPPRVLAAPRQGDRREAVHGHRSALRGACGRLHPHPEDGVAPRRFRADGAHAARRGRRQGGSPGCGCRREEEARSEEGCAGRGRRRGIAIVLFIALKGINKLKNPPPPAAAAPPAPPANEVLLAEIRDLLKQQR
jgi:hypothetical protein